MNTPIRHQVPDNPILNRLNFILSVFILFLALTSGSLSLASIINNFNVMVLLSSISSFVLSCWLVLRLLMFHTWLKHSFTIVLTIFYITTSFILLIQYVQGQSTQFKLPLLVIYIIQLLMIPLNTILNIVLENHNPYDDSESKTIVSNSSTHVYKMNTNENWMNTNISLSQIDSTGINHFKIPPIKDHSHSKSVPNFRYRHSNHYQKSQEMLFHSDCNNSLHKILDINTSEFVQRSKSTSQLNKRINLKSFNDEKVFLQHINESLLPPVLKKGESPILALKRQQDVPIESGHSETLTKGTVKKKKSYDLNDDYLEEQQHDTLSTHLPFISEFDESIDQDIFKDFDQNTKFQYEQSFHGLETIPQLMNKPKWLLKSNSMNHISLSQWNNDEQVYRNIRSRSGANLNIPGITRLISQHTLQGNNRNLNNDDLLLICHPVDDIDDISDIQTMDVSTPLSTHLIRSLSAPSLHTFREPNSDYMNEDISPPVSYRYHTPPPRDISKMELNDETPSIPSSAPASPFKKLFSQTPKKLFRRSVDFTTNYHQHHSSIISNQLSIYTTSSKSNSLKRSRSVSPKRSLRNVLQRKNSSASKSLIAPPTLLKRAIVKAPLLHHEVEAWDIHTLKSSNNSRVSSVPSAVIGEYDREKWNTLKVLANSEQHI